MSELRLLLGHWPCRFGWHAWWTHPLFAVGERVCNVCGQEPTR